MANSLEEINLENKENINKDNQKIQNNLKFDLKEKDKRIRILEEENFYLSKNMEEFNEIKNDFFNFQKIMENLHEKNKHLNIRLESSEKEKVDLYANLKEQTKINLEIQKKRADSNILNKEKRILKETNENLLLELDQTKNKYETIIQDNNKLNKEIKVFESSDLNKLKVELNEYKKFNEEISFEICSIKKNEKIFKDKILYLFNLSEDKNLLDLITDIEKNFKNTNKQKKKKIFNLSSNIKIFEKLKDIENENLINNEIKNIFYILDEKKNDNLLTNSVLNSTENIEILKTIRMLLEEKLKIDTKTTFEKNSQENLNKPEKNNFEKIEKFMLLSKESDYGSKKDISSDNTQDIDILNLKNKLEKKEKDFKFVQNRLTELEIELKELLIKNSNENKKFNTQINELNFEINKYKKENKKIEILKNDIINYKQIKDDNELLTEMNIENEMAFEELKNNLPLYLQKFKTFLKNIDLSENIFKFKSKILNQLFKNKDLEEIFKKSHIEKINEENKSIKIIENNLKEIKNNISFHSTSQRNEKKTKTIYFSQKFKTYNSDEDDEELSDFEFKNNSDCDNKNFLATFNEENDINNFIQELIHCNKEKVNELNIIIKNLKIDLKKSKEKFEELQINSKKLKIENLHISKLKETVKTLRLKLFDQNIFKNNSNIVYPNQMKNIKKKYIISKNKKILLIKKKIDIFEENNNTYNEKFNNLQNQISLLEEENSISNLKIFKIQKEKEKLLIEVNNLNNQIKKIKESIKDSGFSINSNNSTELQEESLKINEMEDIQQVENTIKYLTNEIKNYKKQNEIYSKIIEDNNKKLKNNNTEISTNKNCIKNLSNIINEKKLQINILKENILNLQNEVKNNHCEKNENQKIKDKENRFKSYLDENSNLNEKLNLLTKDVELYKYKYNQYREESKILLQEKDILEDERLNLYQKIRQLTSLNAIKSEQYEIKMTENVKLLIQMAMLKSELKRLADKHYD